MRAYYLRGLLYYEVGNNEMAIDNLEKAISIDPLNYRAFYNLSNLYYSTGNLSNAERIMLLGLQIQPESPEGLQLLKLIQSRN